MIKKTIISFCLILLVYFSFRELIWSDVKIPQNIQQENQMNAQDYLYDKCKDTKVALVGSSMLARLNIDSISGWKNIAISRQNSFTGLGLLKKKECYPKIILIEINTLDQEYSSFDDILYNPIYYCLRKQCLSLRDGRQPLPLIAKYIEKHIIWKIIPSSFDVLKQSQIRSLDNERLKAQLHNRIKMKAVYDMEINNEKEIIRKLHEFVDYFEEHDVKIAFIEMPQHISMKKSLLLLGIEDLIKSDFSNYPLIQDDWAKYEALDGQHLDGGDADLFLSFLYQKVNSLFLQTRTLDSVSK